MACYPMHHLHDYVPKFFLRLENNPGYFSILRKNQGVVTYDIQLITRSYSRIQNYPGYPGCNKYWHI